jgi:hypothetical protein
MLTKMTDADWIKVLRVFEIVRSRRGDKGRDDRKFLSALHYFSVHNITWRALPAEFGIGPDIDPRAALGDKGYDSKSNRNAARQRGICPVIPYRSNVKDIPPSFQRFSTRAAPVSSKQSANSNDSSASHCVVRRQRRIMVRSSHWHVHSS